MATFIIAIEPDFVNTVFCISGEPFGSRIRYYGYEKRSCFSKDFSIFKGVKPMSLSKKRVIVNHNYSATWFFLIFVLAGSLILPARGLTIPSKNWGICFGNSTHFSGLRFNFIDRNIQTINGVNVTLWKPPEKQVSGTVNGFSLGLIPYADRLNGFQLGLLGSGAEDSITGVTIGLIGAGSGGDVKGITIGGIGVGAGGSLVGINIGLVGAGAGENVTGINFGGLGVGAGENLTGLNIGLLGVGAGENVIGINIGGLGVGAGENLTGLSFGLLGVGAGEKLTGITIAGLGAGAGEKLTGLTICGLGAGAPSIRGVTIAGLGLGGKSISGLSVALGTVMVKDDGVISGLNISAFNYIKGTQKGVAIGIVNYAYRLKGIQIGLVNIVRDNPRGRVVLPIINFNF